MAHVQGHAVEHRRGRMERYRALCTNVTEGVICTRMLLRLRYELGHHHRLKESQLG